MTSGEIQAPKELHPLPDALRHLDEGLHNAQIPEVTIAGLLSSCAEAAFGVPYTYRTQFDGRGTARFLYPQGGTYSLVSPKMGWFCSVENSSLPLPYIRADTRAHPFQ